MNLRRPTFAALGVFVLLASSARLWAYSGVVVFGDSLSDVGNVYDQSFHLAPQSPYYQGRYSNGLLWVEQMSLDQGLSAPTPSRNGGSDWAYAGTKTGSGSTFIFPFSFPNIGSQISSYLNGRTPGADQLFAVWGGGNDFIGGQTNPSVPVTNLSNHITALANAGAKQFIVPNLPPLGQTPRFRGTSSEASMDSLSNQFNSLLATTLTNLKTSLNVSITQLDVAGFFHQVLTSPFTYGFTNVTDPAMVNSTVVPNPDQYLFWDDIHPTRIGHRFLGDIASDVLDTHTWISPLTSGSWSATTNWDPSGAPQPRWITNLTNPSATPKSCVVGANSTVRRITVSGATARMTLGIQNNVTLTASESATAASNGRIELNGATLNTPLLTIAGGTLHGSGTIAGSLTQNSAARMEIALGGTSAGQHDVLAVTGAANLGGSLAVSLIGGFVSLPGTSYQTITFGSRSGDVSILNQTGYAGLHFTKSYSATALTLTATATGGDANLDGMVDITDLGVLATNWQTSGDWLEADFTNNGFIDISDLGILATNWQSGASLEASIGALGLPFAVVPEPGSIALLALVGTWGGGGPPPPRRA